MYKFKTFKEYLLENDYEPALVRFRKRIGPAYDKSTKQYIFDEEADKYKLFKLGEKFRLFMSLKMKDEIPKGSNGLEAVTIDFEIPFTDNTRPFFYFLIRYNTEDKEKEETLLNDIKNYIKKYGGLKNPNIDKGRIYKNYKKAFPENDIIVLIYDGDWLTDICTKSEVVYELEQKDIDREKEIQRKRDYEASRTEEDKLYGKEREKLKKQETEANMLDACLMRYGEATPTNELRKYMERLYEKSNEEYYDEITRKWELDPEKFIFDDVVYGTKTLDQLLAKCKIAEEMNWKSYIELAANEGLYSDLKYGYPIETDHLDRDTLYEIILHHKKYAYDESKKSTNMSILEAKKILRKNGYRIF